jgi:hypothetical protein
VFLAGMLSGWVPAPGIVSIAELAPELTSSAAPAIAAARTITLPLSVPIIMRQAYDERDLPPSG